MAPGDHTTQWRDPAEVAAQWLGAPAYDPRMFRAIVRGDWWDVLARSRRTLLISREYEHLLVACGVSGGRPQTTYLPMVHPSGIAIDHDRAEVVVASTR